MIDQHNNSQPIIKAASACVWRGDEVLLVQRGSKSGYGLWAFPGGKQEAGESLSQTAQRELLEETGVIADLQVEVGTYTIKTPEVIYQITNFAGAYRSGEAIARSDALDVRWVRLDEFGTFAMAQHIASAAEKSRVLLKL